MHGYHTWGVATSRPTLDSITRANNSQGQDSINGNQDQHEDIRQCPYCKDVSLLCCYFLEENIDEV